MRRDKTSKCPLPHREISPCKLSEIRGDSNFAQKFVGVLDDRLLLCCVLLSLICCLCASHSLIWPL